MSTILNGPVLGTAGVGKFHKNIGHTGQAVCTALNVIGWIPVASMISGAIRSIAGLRMLSNQSQSKKLLGKAWIARGISEMCCVGFVLAPVDIGCSTARLVMNQASR